MVRQEQSGGGGMMGKIREQRGKELNCHSDLCRFLHVSKKKNFQSCRINLSKKLRLELLPYFS